MCATALQACWPNRRAAQIAPLIEFAVVDRCNVSLQVAHNLLYSSDSRAS